MTTTTLALLALAAFTHSGWNLLTKKSLDKQVFLWLTMCWATVLFFVPFVLIYRAFPPVGWAYILVSGAVEALYYTVLGKAYQTADLSLVYPVARGSAPLFVMAFAFAFLGETVPAQGTLGILLVVAGIYTLHLKSLSLEGIYAPLGSLREAGSRLALLTGCAIATYSVIDKAGIAIVPPEMYIYLVFGASALFMAPGLLKSRREAVSREWHLNKSAVLLVAVLNPGTYLLVLMAMTGSKVSYVSSVREVSVVLAALLGSLVLKEPFGKSKVMGSLLVFAGVLLISLAR